jgi:outer membrane lipopolysaccharide assembly protein LptE/RlpB
MKRMMTLAALTLVSLMVTGCGYGTNGFDLIPTSANALRNLPTIGALLSQYLIGN